MKKILAIVAAALIGLVSSCSFESGPASGVPFRAYSVSPGSTTPYMEFDIYAGQTILVGKLVVSNDSQNLYVTYNISHPDYTLSEVHLWAGNDLTTAPLNSEGVPVPGDFPYKAEGLDTDTYSFTIPFSQIGIMDIEQYCGAELYILAHAALNGPNNETAWSYGTSFESWTGTKRWGWYSTYIINCDNGTPDPEYDFETAFAKGNYVFTTNPKSNPEGLPTLGLTQNRWGWAINLTEDGQTSYDLYAGAGLNKIENGTLVGSLTVVKTATEVTVTYNLLPGFKLLETHVYAGDTPPTTLAPGQYGNTAYFSPLASTYSITIPVSDTDADGIWIIAHSVVGIPQP